MTWHKRAPGDPAEAAVQAPERPGRAGAAHRGLVVRKQSTVETVRWSLSELWQLHDYFTRQQYFVQLYSASLLSRPFFPEGGGPRGSDSCWGV